MAKKTVKSVGKPPQANPAKQKKKPTPDSWFAEYRKYFSAPKATPSSFQILDMTDGSLTTISSHS